MEQHITCSFFGHRKIELTEELRHKTEKIVENLITKHHVQKFLFGSRSDFDYLCHLIVTQLKEKYPTIKRIAYTCKSETCVLEKEKEKLEKIYFNIFKQKTCLIGVEEEFEHKTKYTAGKASYIERNRAMIDDSDYCVFFYDENYYPDTKNCANNDIYFHKSKSGTALAYTYAKQKKKILINMYENNKKS